MKQLIAGGGVALIGTTLVPLLSNLFSSSGGVVGVSMPVVMNLADPSASCIVALAPQLVSALISV